METLLPIIDAPAPAAPPRSEGGTSEGPWLVEALLREQQDLTAVERFSQIADEQPSIAQSSSYSALLPAEGPAPGQQYAFEVDLDRCSGCKACVTACHSLNGLDEQETWRDVGLLHGGEPQSPLMQHVTTACHHCVEPACLNACPVNAYEKDPTTGVVKHLDDQCFGCQYCTLACPYDAPKYHAGKGIVRKCDMCSDRLACGEAPACVQACPHEAIRIRVVDKEHVREASEARAFLPGAPDPDYTLPTTSYKTARVFPRNLLPADYYSVRAEHAHLPLVLMLVLTQLSVGGFLMELVLQWRGGASAPGGALHPLFCLGFGLLALAASTLHLGRPHLAFRAVLGLRHSWLSREILVFGLFAPLAASYAALHWLRPEWFTTSLHTALAALVAAVGLGGVFCSVMIYHVVRRRLWRGAHSAVRFFGTTAVLGLGATLLTTSFALSFGSTGFALSTSGVLRPLYIALAAATSGKLLFESMVLLHLGDSRFSSLRRTALLMTGELARATTVRFAAGAIGGVALPLLMLSLAAPVAPAALVGLSSAAFVSLLAGEIAERYLFFTAVVRQKMPGGLGL